MPVCLRYIKDTGGCWYLNPSSIIQKHRTLQTGALLAGAFVLSFSVRFPLVRWKHHSLPQEYCEDCVARFLKKQGIEKNKVVVCFLSNECRYCRLAAGRISTIVRKGHRPDRILSVLWTETNLLLPPTPPINIGSFPSVAMSGDAFQ